MNRTEAVLSEPDLANMSDRSIEAKVEKLEAQFESEGSLPYQDFQWLKRAQTEVEARIRTGVTVSKKGEIAYRV